MNMPVKMQYFKNPKNHWQFQEVAVAENYTGVVAHDSQDVEVNISAFSVKSWVEEFKNRVK